MDSRDKTDKIYDAFMKYQYADYVDRINGLFDVPIGGMGEVIQLTMALSSIASSASLEGVNEQSVVIATILQRLATESKKSGLDNDEKRYKKGMMAEGLKLFMEMVKMDFDDVTLKRALAKVQSDNPLIVEEKKNLQGVVIPKVEMQPEEQRDLSTSLSSNMDKYLEERSRYFVYEQTQNIIDAFKTPPKDMSEVLGLVMALSRITSESSLENEKDLTQIMATILQRLAIDSKASAMDDDEKKYAKMLMGEGLKIYMDLMKMDHGESVVKAALAKVQTNNPIIVEERSKSQKSDSSTGLLVSQLGDKKDKKDVLDSAAVTNPTEGVKSAKLERAESSALGQSVQKKKGQEKEVEPKVEVGEQRSIKINH